MDDLIVIIIMLALTIVGTITQARKKKLADNQDNSSEEKPHEPDFWETLFEEEKPGPVQAVSEEPTQAPFTQKPPEKKPTLLFEEGSKRIMKFELEDKIKSNEIKKTGIGSQTSRKGALKEFSLKKAVIYSEILNQKYF